MKRVAWVVFVVLVISQIGATDCGGNVLRDSGFDLWCGDSLCAWKVVRGDVRRVGTWNKGDSGVEFLGEDAAIQQTSPVDGHDGSCIEFDMIANVEENADVFLDIDVQADGTVERQERIPTSDWKPVSFFLFVESPYDGIRFEIEKHGAGKAVLAQIKATLSDGCAGITHIVSGPRPNGSGCIGNEDCMSGVCGRTAFPAPDELFGTCVGCSLSDATTCGTGETCGIGDPLSSVLALPIECEPVGTRVLGEQCVSAEQCASGICGTRGSADAGLCGACDASTACGGACGPAWAVTLGDPPGLVFFGPNVCRPGEHAGASGAACGSNADCASGQCNGPPRQICNDGRPCADTSACPVGGDLKPTACNTVGIEGGSCS
jgi:hypothetical protein